LISDVARWAEAKIRDELTVGTADVNVLEVELEVVLTEDHWAYVPPAQNESYSYRRGLLLFREMSELTWLQIAKRPNLGVAGEVPDCGNIERFQMIDDRYELEGDFGQLLIESSAPPVVLAAR
jgi:hypothetical protein